MIVPTVIRMLSHAAADVGASQRVIIMMTGPLMAVTKIAIGHCTSQAPFCSYLQIPLTLYLLALVAQDPTATL